jgi:acetyltransferase-like isoleucine patch superfamily enzyme
MPFRKFLIKTLSLAKKFVRKENSIYTRDLIMRPDCSWGDHTYGKPAIFEWGEGKKISVGKYCSIANEVKFFLGGNHRTDWITTYPFNVLHQDFPNAKYITGHPSSKGDIIIGNDVWIGYGAVILSGVTIGDGAVIGAYTVVAKNIPPYSIVSGNPMQVIKKRFDDNKIQKLLEIKWWEWNEEKINCYVKYLCSDNIDEIYELTKSKKL